MICIDCKKKLKFEETFFDGGFGTQNYFFKFVCIDCLNIVIQKANEVIENGDLDGQN